jgi:hypothetical protein
MRDVESDRQPFVNNPYAAGTGPTTLPARHPFNIIKRCIIMGLSIYGLHWLEVYHTILHSPLVRHEWFKVGLASSVGTCKRQKQIDAMLENSLQKRVIVVLLILTIVPVRSICCTAILAIKAYVEMYAGKIQGKTVKYENFRSSTHAVIFLILLSSFSFHVALWPAYGGLTLLIMAIFGFGILIQFALLVPTYVQNLVGAILMTFFIQEYV